MALPFGAGHSETALHPALGPASHVGHETEQITDLALHGRRHNPPARKHVLVLPHPSLQYALAPAAASAVLATPGSAEVNGFEVAEIGQCWAPAVHAVRAAHAAAVERCAAAADAASAAA